MKQNRYKNGMKTVDFIGRIYLLLSANKMVIFSSYPFATHFDPSKSIFMLTCKNKKMLLIKMYKRRIKNIFVINNHLYFITDYNIIIKLPKIININLAINPNSLFLKCCVTLHSNVNIDFSIWQINFAWSLVV